MKKSIRIIAGILCLAALLSSCSLLDNFKNIGSKPTVSAETTYAELSRLINSPNATSSIDDKTVTFVAYIASEPFEKTFTGEDKIYTYVWAYISRNTDPFYLDVTDLEVAPKEDTYATITGTVTGSIYWTEDNVKEEILDFHAKTAVLHEIPDTEPSYEDKFDVTMGGYNGTFEFLGAHIAKNSFNDVLVVYFNFTNNEADSNVKISNVSNMLRYVDVWFGEQYIKCSRTTFAPDELDGGSLDAYSMTAYTPSGKTQRYYITFDLPEYFDIDEDGDEWIYFDLFNDEYLMTNSVSLYIFDTLDELYD